MRICQREGCEQEVVGRKSSAIYCSVRCNNLALNDRRVAEKWVGVDPDRPCESCGASLTGKRPQAKFCDRACKDRAAKARAIADGRTRERDRARYPREAAHRRAYARQYLKDNPERMRAIRRKRKGQIRAEHHLVIERDWRRMVHRYRGLCAYCQTAPVEHREHVVPLTLGGAASIGNLLPSCATCNYRKHTKLLAVWRYRDGAARALSIGKGVIPTQ